MTFKEFKSAASGFQSMMGVLPTVCVIGRDDYDDFKLKALEASLTLLKAKTEMPEGLKVDPPTLFGIRIYEGQKAGGITFGV